MSVLNSTTLKSERLTDTRQQIQWKDINWKTVEDSVNQLQVGITKAVNKLLPERVMSGLIGMTENFHVPF